MSGISEITSDIEDQIQFADEIFDKGVNKIIENTDLEYIHEQASKYAESGLIKKLNANKKEINELKDRVDGFESEISNNIKYA